MSENLREWIARLAELKYEEGALSVFIEGALRGHEEMADLLKTVGPPPLVSQAPVEANSGKDLLPNRRPGRPPGSPNRTDRVLGALRDVGKPVSVHELRELLEEEDPVHALRACLYELGKTHRAVASRANGEVRWSIGGRDRSQPGPGLPTGES